MSTSEMDGVRSFAASTSFVEDLPQPIEANMQDIPESVLRNSMIEPRVGMEFDSLLEGCIIKEVVKGGKEVKYKIKDEASTDRHALFVLSQDCVTVLPDRYEKLHRLAVGVLEIGAESVENFNVLEKLIDLKDNFPHSCDKQPLSQRKNSIGAASDVVRTEVVRSPMVVKRKSRLRTKRLKSSMEEAISKPKKKRNTTAARNLAQSTSTTGIHN
uniref:Uncharacterized protein n=1 Tax=Fagus sylvatica TaxID=28930 RepID=A0A2N9FF25_FAGSY